MKRFLAGWMMVLLLVPMIFTGTFTAAAATEGIFTYTVTDDTVTITDCDTEVTGDLSIPETLGGYPVVAIGEGAFFFCSSLKSVVIPDGVTSIGGYAFRCCYALESITIPNSVASIGVFAFSECPALENISIPQGVESIGKSTFMGCTSLEGVALPNSITSIGDSAFKDCTSLAAIAIPESVISIGIYAFENCSLTGEVVVPDSVESIGCGAFKSCDAITGITLPFVGATKDNDTTDTHFTHIFGEYGDVEVPANLNKVVITKASQIENYAFSECGGLSQIILSNTLTSIDNFAFNKCSSLKSIVIPHSVTRIGVGAFANCSSLSSIVVEPENPVYYSVDNCLIETNSKTLVAACKTSVMPTDGRVERIGDYAFSGCTTFDSFTIPDQVVYIGAAAFGGCTSLKSIIIPNGFTSISPSVFANCTSLTTITIPKSVTEISYYAFDGCTSLRDVYYDGTAEDRKQIQIGVRNNALKNATWHCKGDVVKVFKDIKAEQWFVTNGAIDFVYNKKLFNGTSTTTFSPDTAMNRGMFVTVLGRLHGVDTTAISAQTKFTDVNSSEYYAKYVKWASDNGIVNGTGATTFSPLANVSREQICAMMVRYCNFAGISLKNVNTPMTFRDASKISGYAKDAVAACQKGGIVNGKDGGVFDPQGKATRAQVATIMMNFYKNYVG